jgi:hypothetical protein
VLGRSARPTVPGEKSHLPAITPTLGRLGRFSADRRALSALNRGQQPGSSSSARRFPRSASTSWPTFVEHQTPLFWRRLAESSLSPLHLSLTKQSSAGLRPAVLWAAPCGRRPRPLAGSQLIPFGILAPCFTVSCAMRGPFVVTGSQSWSA